MSDQAATKLKFPTFPKSVLGHRALLREIRDSGIFITGNGTATMGHSSEIALFETRLTKLSEAFSQRMRQYRTDSDTEKALSLVKKIAGIPFGGLFRKSTTTETKYALVLAGVDLLSTISLSDNEKHNNELLDILSALTKKAKFIGYKGSSGHQSMMEQLIKFYDAPRAVKDPRVVNLALSLIRSFPKKYTGKELANTQMNLLFTLFQGCPDRRNEIFNLAEKIQASSQLEAEGRKTLSNLRKAYFDTKTKNTVIELGRTPSIPNTQPTPSDATVAAAGKPELVADESANKGAVKKNTTPVSVSVLNMLGPVVESFRRHATTLCTKARSACASLAPDNLFSYRTLKRAVSLTGLALFTTAIVALSPSSAVNTNPNVTGAAQLPTVAAHQPFQSAKQMVFGSAAQNATNPKNTGTPEVVTMGKAHPNQPTNNSTATPAQTKSVKAPIKSEVSDNSASTIAPAAVDAETGSALALASQPFMIDGSVEAIAIKDTLQKMPKWLQNLSVSEDADDVVNVCNQVAAELLKVSKDKDYKIAKTYKEAAALLVTYGAFIVDNDNKVSPALAEPICAKMAYMLAWGIGMDKPNIPAALAYAKVAGDAENGVGKRLMELFPSTRPSQTKMAYSHSLYDFKVN